MRKVGEQYYFNVVRAGSHVTDPASIDLDTGEKLKWEIISGKQAAERKLPIGETLKDDSEIVVTYLVHPLDKGATNRIRLLETYADPKSYYIDGEELVWDRTFGRLRNTVVLPPGWYLTTLVSPATIQTLPDGRISIYVVNPRNDDVRVYFRARRRPLNDLVLLKSYRNAVASAVGQSFEPTLPRYGTDFNSLLSRPITEISPPLPNSSKTIRITKSNE